MSEHDVLEILEQKHSLKVLVILDDHGPMYKGELASKITVGTATVQARVQDLIDRGLVLEEPQPVKPFKKIISLTENGKTVATHLKAIESLL